MKTPTNNIFQLIRSMTPSEKRYFKRHYSSERSLTTILFDFINKMDVYDEDLVKENFKGTKLAKNLKVYKVQLADLLLKSLTSYYNKKSIKSKIRIGVEEVEILMDKGLYDLAENKLKKVKALCLKYEEYGQMFSILMLEVHLNYFYKIRRISQYPIFEEINEQTEVLKNIFRLQHISFELSDKINSELTESISKKHLLSYDKILKEELKKSENNKRSFQEQYYLYISLAKLNSVNSNDVQNEYKFKKKTIELFDNYAHLTETHPRLYWAALYNYLQSCFRLKKFEELEKGIETLKEFTPKYPSTERNLIFIYLLETNYYYKQKKYNEIINSLEELTKKHIKKYRQETELSTMYLYTYFAITYMILNKPQKVHYYLRRLHLAAKNSPPVYSQSFDLLELISHYETNDYNLIQNLIVSYRRKHNKAEETTPFFKEMLGFLAKLNKLADDEKAAFTKTFYDNLASFESDPVNRFLKGFLLEDWLTAIQEGHSFSAQMQ